MLVREMGITALRWYVEAVKNCSGWWIGHEAPVRVPVLRENGVGVFSLSSNCSDVFSAGEGIKEGVFAQLAKLLRELLKLIVIELLIWEGEDVVFKPGFSDLFDGFFW